jgi:hypothetical protein
MAAPYSYKYGVEGSLHLWIHVSFVVRQKKKQREKEGRKIV